MKNVVYILFSLNILFAQDGLKELINQDKYEIENTLLISEIKIQDAIKEGNKVEKFLQQTQIFLDTLNTDKDFGKCLEITDSIKSIREKEKKVKYLLKDNKISETEYNKYIFDLNTTIKNLEEIEDNLECNKYNQLIN